MTDGVLTKDSNLRELVQGLEEALLKYQETGDPAVGWTIMRGIMNGHMVWETGHHVQSPYQSAEWYAILRAAKDGKISVDHELIAL